MTAALPEPAIAVSDSRKSSFAEGGKGTMWLRRKSRWPAMETAKILPCFHTLVSFLKEKH